MNENKITKKSLILSGVTLLMSLVLMLGTTYAWYTDTISSGVNVIASGNLDVAIQVKNNEDNWVDASTSTSLGWYAADENTTAVTSWNRNSEYYLEEFQVKNTGALSLDYCIDILGQCENSKAINEYIDFEFSVSEDSQGATKWEPLNTSKELAVDGCNTIKIKAKAKANIPVKGVEIVNITIKINTVQGNGESDSFSNDYDAIGENTYVVNSSSDMTRALSNSSIDSVVITSNMSNSEYINVQKNINIFLNDDVEIKSSAKGQAVLQFSNASGNPYDAIIEGNGIINGTNAKSAVRLHGLAKSSLTIKGGTFLGHINDDGKKICIQAGQGKLYIEGGVFEGEINKEDEEAIIIITGGNFTDDPSAYVKSGYTATQNSDGTWTVSKSN